MTGPERVPTLVIGVGNRDRGDDAAGPMVAEQVERAGLGRSVTTLVMEGDLSDLSLRWSSAEAVIIIDAAVTGAPAGTIHRWSGLPPTDQQPLSSHGISLRDALELGRLLGRTARSIDIIGIEGQAFDLFSRPTTDVARSVEVVADGLVDGLRQRDAAGAERHRPPVE